MAMSEEIRIKTTQQSTIKKMNYIPSLNFYVMDANGKPVRSLPRTKAVYPTREQWESTLTERVPYQPTKKDLETLRDAVDEIMMADSSDEENSFNPPMPVPIKCGTHKCKYCVSREEVIGEYFDIEETIYERSEAHRTILANVGNLIIRQMWDQGYRTIKGKITKKHPYMK